MDRRRLRSRAQDGLLYRHRSQASDRAVHIKRKGVCLRGRRRFGGAARHDANAQRVGGRRRTPRSCSARLVAVTGATIDRVLGTAPCLDNPVRERSMSTANARREPPWRHSAGAEWKRDEFSSVALAGFGVRLPTVSGRPQKCNRRTESRRLRCRVQHNLDKLVARAAKLVSSAPIRHLRGVGTGYEKPRQCHTIARAYAARTGGQTVWLHHRGGPEYRAGKGSHFRLSLSRPHRQRSRSGLSAPRRAIAGSVVWTARSSLTNGAVAC